MPKPMTDSDKKPQAAKPYMYPSSKRKKKAVALGQTISRLTGPVFVRHGLADGTIVRNWRLIVGDLIANHTAPEKITYPAKSETGGQLHLRVSNSGIALQLQYLEPIILEKVNGYFGYSAVNKLRVLQGPLPEGPEEDTAWSPRPLTAPEEEQLTLELSEIEDPELRRSLENLGRAIIGRKTTS